MSVESHKGKLPGQTGSELAAGKEIYQNPVYHRDFPDPFILKFAGEYWAYCTGFWDDGRCFGILHSTDLVHWEKQAGALAPLPGNATCYWAPEVTYWDGQFYMYYSVGDEVHMSIRVAVAAHPAGPFIDSEYQLTAETFAIDPHVFTDDDGQRYLFYATDFLDYARIGTGTVQDRLLTPFQLAGQARPVTRARYDWQIYDPARANKGGVQWHTVEGPFVLKHKNLYYQMFSGGNWQNLSYGATYATTTHIDQIEEWTQTADGIEVLPVLRTIPGLVVGPGHNSVVRGPDNRQLFCVYHCWAADGSGRQMAIDPLDWAGERLLVFGPSTGPQSLIWQPTITGPDVFDSVQGLHPDWQLNSGEWHSEGRALVQSASSGPASLSYQLPAAYFLAEVSLNSLASSTQSGGTYGLELTGESGESLLTVQFETDLKSLKLGWADQAEQGLSQQSFDLEKTFRPEAAQLVRLEVAGTQVRVEVGDAVIRWSGQLKEPPVKLGLVTQNTAATFQGFALTVGWEDLFTDASLVDWQGATSGWQIQSNLLTKITTGGETETEIISKGPALQAYELVVNAAIDNLADRFTIYPLYTVNEAGLSFRLESVDPENTHWKLVCSNPAVDLLPLPAEFNPLHQQQFRFRKQVGYMQVFWENHKLGELTIAPAGPTTVGLAGSKGVKIDLVRVTALNQL